MITKVITKRKWEIAKTTGEIHEESLIKRGLFIVHYLNKL